MHGVNKRGKRTEGKLPEVCKQLKSAQSIQHQNSLKGSPYPDTTFSEAKGFFHESIE